MSDVDLERKLVGDWNVYHKGKQRGIVTLKRNGKFTYRVASDDFATKLGSLVIDEVSGTWDAREKKDGVYKPYFRMRVQDANFPSLGILGPLKHVLQTIPSTLAHVLNIFDDEPNYISKITKNEITFNNSKQVGEKWIRR